MKQERKGPKAHTKAAQAQIREMDRKSGTGMTGSPKKGGHGGKFTWVGHDGPHSESEINYAVTVVDDKDPNFDEPEPLHASS